jgi:hypothetical protein
MVFALCGDSEPVPYGKFPGLPFGYSKWELSPTFG